MPRIAHLALLLLSLVLLLASSYAWASAEAEPTLSLTGIGSLASLILSGAGIAYSAGVLASGQREHQRRLACLDGKEGVIERLARVEAKLDGLAEQLGGRP